MFRDDYVELMAGNHHVLTRSPRQLERWLARGFLRVPEELLFFTLSGAFAFYAPPAFYAAVWKRLFPRYPLPPFWNPNDVVRELARAARGPAPQLYVLERVIERGRRHEKVMFEAPPLPPRTATDHYVVIEAVRDTQTAEPVAGLRLELLIADGEIRTAQTDAQGVARVERIQAGRVVIRVLGLDGELWRSAEGEDSQPSGSNDRASRHVVKQGECLTKIAHQHGLEHWERVWKEPGNERLRKRRRTPHLLVPGDEVDVPAIRVHEIIRPTDATHRIIVCGATATFRAILQDHNQRSFKNQPYELYLPEQPREPLRKGTTDDRGGILESLRPETQRVEVRLVRLGLSWAFALSDLIAMPADEAEQQESDGAAAPAAVMAAQARLNALGFASGPVDGKLGPRTRAALTVYGAARSSDGPALPEELSGDQLLALHDRFLA